MDYFSPVCGNWRHLSDEMKSVLNVNRMWFSEITQIAHHYTSSDISNRQSCKASRFQTNRLDRRPRWSSHKIWSYIYDDIHPYNSFVDISSQEASSSPSIHRSACACKWIKSKYYSSHLSHVYARAAHIETLTLLGAHCSYIIGRVRICRLDNDCSWWAAWNWSRDHWPLTWMVDNHANSIVFRFDGDVSSCSER